MKNSIRFLMVLMALAIQSCQKEELIVHDEPIALEAESTSYKADYSWAAKSIEAVRVSDEVPFFGRWGHTSAVLDNKIWVLGGASAVDGVPQNDAWYTNDGLVWKVANENAPFRARRRHASAVFQNKLWITGGQGILDSKHELFAVETMNDVWWSSDGVKWNQVQNGDSRKKTGFPTRYGHTLTVFNGALWLIGGNAGFGDGVQSDIWRSEDGINWSQVVADAPFGVRQLHAAVAHNGKLWVIGGRTRLKISGNQLVSANDVWYSSTGYTWTRATSNAAFSPRICHALVSDGEWMWLTAGQYQDSGNAIWRSKNGTNWYQALTSQPYPQRSFHTSLFFNNKLWAINGMRHDNSDAHAHGDIWSFKDPDCCEIDDITLNN